MSRDIRKEDQIAYVSEYYRANIQSALEPILFDEINGTDWQVMIGTFLQDQLEDIHNLEDEEVIQYIFERKPSQRVIELLRQNNEEPNQERRLGFDRRGGDRRNEY